jgi:hypothetical protein
MLSRFLSSRNHRSRAQLLVFRLSVGMSSKGTKEALVIHNASVSKQQGRYKM